MCDRKFACESMCEKESIYVCVCACVEVYERVRECVYVGVSLCEKVCMCVCVRKREMCVGARELACMKYIQPLLSDNLYHI